MFEKIFSFSAVLRRHREGPFASERLEYLKYLSDRGLSLGTVLRHASYCLCIAREIQRWPRDHCFDAGGLRPSPLLGQRNAWHRDELLLLAGPRSSSTLLLVTF
jgi:hypothetical protein